MQAKLLDFRLPRYTLKLTQLHEANSTQSLTSFRRVLNTFLLMYIFNYFVSLAMFLSDFISANAAVILQTSNAS